MAAAVLNTGALRRPAITSKQAMNWTIGISILLHFAIGWYFVRGLVGEIRTEIEPEVVRVLIPERVVPPPPPPPPKVETDKIENHKPRQRPAVPSPVPTDVPSTPLEAAEPVPDATGPVATTPPAPAAPQAAPRPTRRVTPAYPDKAIARDVEGYATVQITVGAGGAVTSIAVVDESPRNYGFGKSAVAAVARWEFADAQPGAYLVTVRFDLQ